MKLSLIFEALASGELSNLHLADSQERIRPEKLEPVLRSINLGLIDLHTRFLLKKGFIDLAIQAGNRHYELNNPEVIEILKVFKQGHELVKSPNQFDGFCLLKPTYLYMNTDPKHDEVLRLECKMRHRLLTADDIALDSEVDLPLSHLNALLYFIGSRLFVSIPNQLDGDLNEGMRYAQRYQAEIALLTEQGIDVDGLDEHCWFSDRGFV